MLKSQVKKALGKMVTAVSEALPSLTRGPMFSFPEPVKKKKKKRADVPNLFFSATNQLLNHGPETYYYIGFEFSTN